MFILKNKLLFTISYFSILIIDIVVKFNLEKIPFRFFTKPLIIVFLLLFYWVNNKGGFTKKHFFMIIALFFFLMGDMFLLFKDVATLFSLGMLSFVLGKLFYAFRFSNQNDFKLTRLFPILSFCFIYIFIILSVIYDNLGSYFFPVLIYLFIAMLVLQFAYLRKSEVNYKSYLIVGIGILFSILSDSIAVLSRFYYNGFFYEKITVILFYGISQYLIVVGIIAEKPNTEDKFGISYNDYVDN